jgi:universal stress protein E
MPSDRPIVVGIDFTPCSRTALEQAVRIGTFTASPVHPVHVIDTLVVIDFQEAVPSLAKDIQDNLIADARKAWDQYAADLNLPAPLTLEVAVNNRVEGVLRKAESLAASLLVLGAYGDREPDLGIGTVATGCVRRSRADVLLVRSSHAGHFRRVVACVDFSPTSIQALEKAAALAQAEGAELRVLHAFAAPWHRLHYRSPTPEALPQFQKQYRDALERRLQSVATEVAARCAPKGGSAIKPVCELIDDNGHRSAIVEYAARTSADLVVLGTRGRTNLRDVFLGSTAEKTLMESKCSILAVKPDSPAGPFGRTGAA